MVGISFFGLTSGVSALLKTAVLVVGVFRGGNSLEDGGALPAQEAKMVLAAKDASSFDGEFASSMPVILASEGKTVLLIGLGEKSTTALPDHKAMELGGAIYARLEEIKASQAVIIAPQSMESRLAYGAMLRSFNFNKYFNSKKSDHVSKVEKISLAVAGDVASVERDFALLKTEGESVFFTRSLVSEPANILYPEEYARRINDELSPLGVKVEILDEDRMKSEGMGALLGVGQGSSKKSCMVIMRWNGDPKSQDTLAFVGKGVTFDTGGVSLKPSKGMCDMKYDMAGSAAVAGLMRALAARKAQVNAVGVVGLVENALGGNAQRPGDIVTSMSGQTIEVLNTDAEGRLLLADALWYTQKTFSPKFIVDLATLTGAIVVALGEGEYAGLFSNDDTLSEQLLSSGKAAGERLWRMPIGDAYDKMIDSPVADMKNIATDGRGADSITAAQFLQRFVNNLPWAHLDIAGTAWNSSGSKIAPKGATGFGVMLLNKFVKQHHEKPSNT